MPRTLRNLAIATLSCLLPLGLTAKKITDIHGRTIDVEILTIHEGSLTMRHNGKEFKLPFDRLSPESREDLIKERDSIIIAEDPYEQINEVLGLELYADGNLWDDQPAEIAQRLGWQQVGSDPKNTCFSKDYKSDTQEIAGAKVNMGTLYMVDGKLDRIVFTFANRLDSASFDLSMDKPEKAIKAAAKAIEADTKILLSSLKTLGESQRFDTDKGYDESEIERRDTENTAFVLETKESYYVSLRMMPSAQADKLSSPPEEIPESIREKRQANWPASNQSSGMGDVILPQLLERSKAPLGSANAQLMESYLERHATQSDPYHLATAYNAADEAIDNALHLISATQDNATRMGFTFYSINIKDIDAEELSNFWDASPIVWLASVTTNFEQTARALTNGRSSSKNVLEWKSKRKELLKNAQKIENDKEFAKLLVIIGRNHNTKEIAFTDGKEIYWIDEDTANDASLGQFWKMNN